jgi:hypothetical protein
MRPVRRVLRPDLLVPIRVTTYGIACKTRSFANGMELPPLGRRSDAARVITEKGAAVYTATRWRWATAPTITSMNAGPTAPPGDEYFTIQRNTFRFSERLPEPCESFITDGACSPL